MGWVALNRGRFAALVGLALVVVAGIVLLLGREVRSAPVCTVTWDTAGHVDDDWSNGANWINPGSPGAPPGAADRACSAPGDAIAISGFTATVASADLEGGLTVASGSLELTTDGSTVHDLTLENGAIDGAASVDITGTSDVPSGWTGFLRGSGPKHIVGGATFDATATGTSTSLYVGDTGGSTSLVNDGTLKLAYFNGLGDGVVLDNEGTLVAEVLGAGPPTWYVQHSGAGSQPQLTNDGTFTTRTNGYLQVPFDNGGTGVLDVQGGRTVVQADNGTIGSDTGEYKIAAPGELQLAGGTRTVDAGASVSGTGLLRLNGSSVTWNASTGVPHLQQDSGTLDGSGTLTVTGSLVMTGGTQQGAGTTKVGASATLDVQGYFSVIPNRTFENAGTGTVSTSFQVCGNATPTDATTFRNSGTLTFSSLSDIFVYWCGEANESFVNTSTGHVVVDMPGGNTAHVQTLSENDGTVTVNAGSVAFATGTPTGSVDDGAYVTTIAGQSVGFAGARSFGATSSTSGPGFALFTSGTNTFTSGATLARAVLSGSTWTGDVTVTGSLDVIDSSTLTGAGVTAVGSGATASLGSYLSITNGHELRNQGTVNDLSSGYVYLCDAGSTLRNQGTFNALSSNAFIQDYCGTARGVVNEVGATFTANVPLLGGYGVYSAFDNDGTVQVLAGALNAYGGTSAGESDGGTWTVATGQALHFGNSATRLFAAGSSIGGTGTTWLDSGQLAGTATIASGTFRWNGGTPTSTGGTTTVESGATLVLASYGSLDGGTLRNEGTFSWLSGSIYTNGDGRIENAGLWTLADGQGIYDGGSATGGVVNEPAGGIVKAGAGTTSLVRPFTNDGTLAVNGGVLSVDDLSSFDGGTSTLGGGTYIVGGGALRVTGLAVTTLDATVVLNAGGTVEDGSSADALADLDTIGSQGALVVDQPGRTWTSAATFSVSGALEVRGAHTVTVDALSVSAGATAAVRDAGSTLVASGISSAGSLSGSGVFQTTSSSANATAPTGRIKPGSNLGVLSFDNPAGQGVASLGSLDVEIGGTAPGTHDELVESGPGRYCPCGGTLNISTLGSYTPTVGDTITIASSPNGLLAPSFSTVTGRILPGGTTYYAVSFTPTDVVLTVTALPAISVDDVSLAEGNSGTTDMTFTVARDSDAPFPVSVDWATNDGTATAGSDYVAGSGTVTFNPGDGLTKTVTVAIDGDLLNEADETFTVDLSNASAATVSDSQGIGTITNDDPLPSLSIGDAALAEGNSGTADASFTVTLSAPSGRAVTVDYATADGTATTAGNDYTATAGTLTIPAGSTTGTITVPVKGDTAHEPDETFFVDLSNPGNATIADAQGLGTITNDDPAITVDDVAVAEGDTGTTDLTFTVSLSQASALATNVGYATADGTATTADSDYTATAGTLTIPAGSTSGTVTVQVNGDTKHEANETLLLNLTGTDNGTITDGQGQGTITNDDAAPVMSIAGASVAEGSSLGFTPVNLTVSLSAPSGLPASASYTFADGTATLGSDYFAFGGTVTFAPGETSKTVTAFVFGDQANEPNETFTATLSAPTGATIGSGTATVTILDDDSIPSISVNDVSVLEGTGGTSTATFTVSLSNPSGLAVTVAFATGDGTATSPADYTPVAGTLSFSPGDVARTVTVPIATDAVFEPNETFFLNLSSPVNATLADAQGQATIVDDDNTIIVTSTTDAVDATPGDRRCATAADECTLRAAIEEANALPGTQTVVLQAAATYPLSVAGAGEDAATSGDLDVTDGLVLVGNGSTIDATGLSDRVLQIVGSGFSVSISNARFTGGLVTTTTGTTDDGGAGIYVSSTTTPVTLNGVTVDDNTGRYGAGVLSLSVLTVHDSSFTGNDAETGGGLYALNALTLTNSTFTTNTATACGGGLTTQGGGTISGLVASGNTASVCGAGLLHVGGSLAVSGSDIGGNATGGWGGGLINEATITVTTTEIHGNSATYGGGYAQVVGSGTLASSAVYGNTTAGSDNAAGGILIADNLGPSSLQLNVVQVHDNAALNGGGILHTGGDLVVDGGSVKDNTATFFGGGVLNVAESAGSTATLGGVEVRGNAAAIGGGIYQRAGAPLLTVATSTIADNTASITTGAIAAAGPVKVTRSTISGNGAPADAAITVSDVASIASSTISSNSQVGVATSGAGQITMSDSTVTGNAGAGIANPSGSFTVTNSIISDQVAPAPDCSGTITSGGYNLASDLSCGFTSTGDVEGASALLGPLANNGGPTLTHLPGIGSPAVDTGSTVEVIDQRGVTRPAGPAPDKGAVEAPFLP